jgi:hypothetical protein
MSMAEAELAAGEGKVRAAAAFPELEAVDAARVLLDEVATGAVSKGEVVRLSVELTYIVGEMVKGGQLSGRST